MRHTIKYITTLFILSVSFSYGQQGNVGINTTNPQGILHIDGAKDNADTPTAEQLANDFVVKNNSGRIRVGIGNIAPKVKLDARAEDNSNSAIGFGTTTLSASAANEGAIRYNPSNTGSEAKVEYSNSTEWIPLWKAPFPPKVSVIAYKDNSRVQFTATDSPFNPSASPVYNQSSLSNNGVNYMVQWTKRFEGIRNADGSTTTTNYFNADTGVFTAPRDGNYLVTFTYALAPITIDGMVGGSQQPIQIEAVWRLFDDSANWNISSNLINSVKCANSFTKWSSSNIDAGSNCTATFHMKAGQRLVPYTWMNLNQNHGNSNTLKTSSGGYSGYNNLTIAEQ